MTSTTREKADIIDLPAPMFVMCESCGSHAHGEYMSECDCTKTGTGTQRLIGLYKGRPPADIVSGDGEEMVSADMVERACSAYAKNRYEGEFSWPDDFNWWEQEKARDGMRDALAAALTGGDRG